MTDDSSNKVQKFDVNAMLPPSLRGKMIGGEKATGIVTALLLLGAAGLLGWYLLPPLVIIMKNLVLFGGLCLAAGTMAAAVLHPGFRKLVSTTYAVWVRKLHNKIIQKSPYDWARFIIQRSKEFIAAAAERLGNLRGANSRLKKLIEKNRLTMTERADRSKAAERLGRVAERDVQLRIIGQIEASNTRLNAQLEVQENLTKMLQVSLENGRLKIEEEEAQVELAIEENSAMMEAQGVASDVVAAIQRDPASAENFNVAMNTIAMSTAEKLGSIEQLMTDLAPVMSDMELGKMVNLERGKRALEALEQRNAPPQLKAVPVRVSIPDDDREAVPVGVGAKSTGGFSAMFDSASDKKNRS